MNKLLKLALAGSIFASGCTQLSTSSLTNPLALSTSTQQEAWVNKTGARADFKDTSECGIQAKIATKQIMAAENPSNNMFGQISGMVKESMEESQQVETCMLGKGYVKIKVAPGQVLPVAKQEAILPSPIAATALSTASQQEAWVNKMGVQADFKDTSDCGIQAKIATKQLTAKENTGSGILEQISGTAKESMQESQQVETCMLGKGYVKINIAPGQVLPISKREKRARIRANRLVNARRSVLQ